MEYILRGARLIDALADVEVADLAVRDGAIAEIHPAPRLESPETALPALPLPADDAADPEPIPTVDVSDMILAPGFIDVHTHGGGGHNLHTTDPDEIRAYARWAASTGVTSFLVGVVGVPEGLPLAQLSAAAVACEHPGEGAEPLGIHLEGPFISEERRGAHATSWLRLPGEDETAEVLVASNGCLRLVTLAPELHGAAEMIRALVAAGVTVSIGHTDATYEQARAAIALGATHATHCCNAMRPLHHRDPGPLGAIAEARTVRGEVIADGVHVHPAMVRLLVRLLGADRTVVITDALAGAGMPNATFEFAGQRATVVNGAARLADGTITGSTLTMDHALRNILDMADVSLREAVGMLTYNPAQSAGVGARKGRLAPGYDADLILLDAALHLQATICRGRITWASEKWAARLPVHVAAGR